MKAKKKDIEPKVESEVFMGMTFTVNEALNKYKAPEYASPKLKKVEEKFRNGIKFKPVANG